MEAAKKNGNPPPIRIITACIGLTDVRAAHRRGKNGSNSNVGMPKRNNATSAVVSDDFPMARMVNTKPTQINIVMTMAINPLWEDDFSVILIHFRIQGLSL